MDRYAFRNFAALETAAQHEIWMKRCARSSFSRRSNHGGCGTVKDAPIITSRKIISGTEIKNHSSRAIRVPPKSNNS